MSELITQGNNSGTGQLISNYAQLAMTAKQSGNNSQCELYCNKIIELDPTNAAAWMLKGSAAGWQSTLANLRVEEMIVCFQKGIQFSGDSETRQSNENFAKTELKNVLTAIVQLRCERFEKWPDQEEATAISNISSYILSILAVINQGVTVLHINDVLFPAGIALNKAATVAQFRIGQNFFDIGGQYPDSNAYFDYLEKMKYVYSVYKVASIFSENDYENAIKVYKNIIGHHKECMNAQAYLNTYYDGRWLHTPYVKLSGEQRASRQREIDELNQKISEVQRKINQAYWADHASERTRLESERKELESEVRALQQELAGIGKLPAITGLQSELEALRKERSGLGLFKIKEKKTLDAKISETEAKLQKIVSDKKDPLNRAIDQKTDRIKQINQELTRDR